MVTGDRTRNVPKTNHGSISRIAVCFVRRRELLCSYQVVRWNRTNWDGLPQCEQAWAIAVRPRVGAASGAAPHPEPPVVNRQPHHES